MYYIYIDTFRVKSHKRKQICCGAISKENILRSKKDDMGFTLAELITVLGIVLVFFSFSIISFRRAYQDSLIRNATRELAYSLTYARDSAILEGINYEVSFFPAENKYKISAAVDSHRIRDKEIDTRKSSFYNYLPDKISFSKLNSQKIIFYPDGSSEDLFVYLQDSNNKIYTITVKGVYSQIRTFDYYYFN